MEIDLEEPLLVRTPYEELLRVWNEKLEMKEYEIDSVLSEKLSIYTIKKLSFFIDQLGTIYRTPPQPTSEDEYQKFQAFLSNHLLLLKWIETQVQTKSCLPSPSEKEKEKETLSFKKERLENLLLASETFSPEKIKRTTAEIEAINELFHRIKKIEEDSEDLINEIEHSLLSFVKKDGEKKKRRGMKKWEKMVVKIVISVVSIILVIGLIVALV